MISLKKCGEIAVSIFVKCVTIIQIIFLFVLINATFQQWSFKIPPLIVMIAINLCLIFCTKMGKIPTEYWQWKKDKVGIFLIWLNSFGYLVSKTIIKYFVIFLWSSHDTLLQLFFFRLACCLCK